MLFLENKYKSLVLFSVLGCFTLTGCEEKLTPSYLMRHPAILKKELDDCQFAHVKSGPEKNRCEMVLFAVANVQSLINEIREDPEKFGQKILDEEIECAKAKSIYVEWQQKIIAQKAQNQSSAELQLIEEKRNAANITYQDQQEKVQILLAVLGMGSPG